MSSISYRPRTKPLQVEGNLPRVSNENQQDPTRPKFEIACLYLPDEGEFPVVLLDDLK